MNVAVLGLGFMGATHVKAWREVNGVQLTGVMTSDPGKKGAGGNLSVSPEPIDFADARVFGLIESVLADARIDAVDICLPTDLHAPVAVAALRAGKHVLVEKPIALDFASAESMRLAAREAGRVLMAAQVLRFFPAYRKLADQVKGMKVISAQFHRNCGQPVWSAWLLDSVRSGGPVLDLLIHDIDFCLSLWGMPEAVRAIRSREAGDLIHAELTYPKMAPVTIEGGWHPSPEYPFSMDFQVTGEHGVFRNYEVEGVDPFRDELQYFADCVNQGREPKFCPPADSAQAVRLARLMLESRESHGRTLRTS